MSTPPARENFIPVSLADLVAELGSGFPGPDQAAFERFARLMVALLRHEIGTALDELKSIYQPFDPDRDTVARAAVSKPPERALGELRRRIRAVLERANYVELPRAALDAALTKTSPLGLAVSVDLEDFDDFGVYYRGVGDRTELRRSWKSRFRRAPVTTPVYRRVFLLIKARATDEPVESGDLDPRHLLLKLFKDVPHSDLEMLLPNTRVRMQRWDKITLGLTGGGGTVGGVVATASKIGAAAAPSTWIIAIAGLAGVLWRQLSRVFAKRTKYMATLAQRLYFHSLDNNLGVLTRLLESALEEEAKEALLAFAELTAARAPLTRDELDRRIEARLRERFDTAVDFEVDDGLAKLRRHDLLAEDGGRLSAVDLDQALRRLDRVWDALFQPEDSRAS